MSDQEVTCILERPASMPLATATPDAIARDLETELAQKRAAWQRDQARLRSLRVTSFAFLFLILAGTVIGALLCFSRVQEARGNPTAAVSSR